MNSTTSIDATQWTSTDTKTVNVATDLERARLELIADIHDIARKVLIGREEVLSNIMISAWQKSKTPRVYFRQYTADGTYAIQETEIVALEATSNGTNVELRVNASPFPWLLNKGASSYVVTGRLESITINGCSSTSPVYIMFYNERAALLH